MREPRLPEHERANRITDNPHCCISLRRFGHFVISVPDSSRGDGTDNLGEHMRSARLLVVALFLPLSACADGFSDFPGPAPTVRNGDKPDTPPVHKAALPPVDRPAVPPVVGRRIALVIGNAKYMYAPKLGLPVIDAKGLSAALRKLEFDVLTEEDLYLERNGLIPLEIP